MNGSVNLLRIMLLPKCQTWLRMSQKYVKCSSRLLSATSDSNGKQNTKRKKKKTSATSTSSPLGIPAEQISKKAYKAPSKKYQHTVFLPATTIPSWISNFQEYEANIRKSGNWEGMYARQRSQSWRREEFVLHDGPPYANGDLHMGHALNKILKDITGRQKMLEGHRLHYRPGWDCHGLPIELKAIQRKGAAADGGLHHREDHREDLSPMEIRKKARDFAEECVSRQSASFQRWGVMGDWKTPYLTSHPRYVAEQLRIFAKMQQQGYIYQAHLPVHYSPSSRSTLAEAELEYRPDHTSTALLLAMRATTVPHKLQSHLSGLGLPHLYVPVYTTTPWTLPFNQAVCYNPDLQYYLVRLTPPGGRAVAVVWAKDLLEKIAEISGVQFEVVGKLNVEHLAGVQYSPPLGDGLPRPLLPGDHVTADFGTGLVHTAPAHGKDDYRVGVKHGLELNSAIDDLGRYEASAGPLLEGLPVLAEGSDVVLEMLGQRAVGSSPSDVLLLRKHTLQHSYPYDWRTKQPVIVRATLQWFVDVERLRPQALDAMRDVSVHPPHAVASCQHGLERAMSRPYWCISRQRVWGTPLPVFYERDTREAVVDQSIVDHVSNVIEREGCDSWWTLPEEQLLPPALVQLYRRQDRLLPVKGSDILDIWFDSGVTWHTLEGRTADMVVEGVDQYGGWFQTGLLTCLAHQQRKPYKSILVHGFTVDESGRKMSKSLGNVVDPSTITDGNEQHQARGTDVLRWWVCLQGTQHFSPQCGHKVLAECSDQLARLRSVIRLILGCLSDYPGREDGFEAEVTLAQYEELPLLERYALHRLHRYDETVQEYYRQYRYHSITDATLQYVITELSQVYLHAVKHRLYCGPRNGHSRRSVQLVLHQVLRQLLLALTPIVPHFTEEVSRAYNPDCVSPQLWVRRCLPSYWHSPSVADCILHGITVRDCLSALLGTASNSGERVPVTRRLDVTVAGAPLGLKALQPERHSDSSLLCEFLHVASVTIIDAVPNSEMTSSPVSSAVAQSNPNDLVVTWSTSVLSPCLRCRQYRVVPPEELCKECAVLVASWQDGESRQTASHGALEV